MKQYHYVIRLLIFFFIQMMFVPYVTTLALEILSRFEIPLTTLIITVNIIVQLLGIVGLFFLSKPLLRFNAFETKPIKKTILLILKTLGYMVLFNLVYNFFLEFMQINPTPTNQQIIESLFEQTPVLIFISATILAPIFEELYYRQLLIVFDSEKMVKITLVLSSLLFGIAHLVSYSVEELIYLPIYTMMGFFIGLSYVKTRRIVYPILIHATINLLSFVGMFLS